MDATTQALLISAVAAAVGNIVKMHFDEVRRRSDREQDRLDRAAAAKLTAEHRDLMAAKLDTNTAVTVQAAEKTDKIVQQTNGMKTELVALTQKAAFAEGKLAGASSEPAHIDVTVHTEPKT